jgi:hypothetical protein
MISEIQTSIDPEDVTKMCVEAAILGTYYVVTKFFSEESLSKEMIRRPTT